MGACRLWYRCWYDGRHLRKIVRPILQWPVIIHGVIIRLVEYPGRRPGCSTLRHIDDECLIHHLPARIVRINSPTHLLFRPQGPLSPRSSMIFSRYYLKRHVRRVKGFAERVGVFPENEVPHIVYQIIFSYLHKCGGGTRPLDPDLTVQHGGHIRQAR